MFLRKSHHQKECTAKVSKHTFELKTLTFVLKLIVFFLNYNFFVYITFIPFYMIIYKVYKPKYYKKFLYEYHLKIIELVKSI